MTSPKKKTKQKINNIPYSLPVYTKISNSLYLLPPLTLQANLHRLYLEHTILKCHDFPEVPLECRIYHTIQLG